MILQQIVNGLAIGCVYGLIALGFVLIFKATEVINFAQGELVMLGAFIAYSLITLLKLHVGIALLLTPIICGGLAVVMERVLVRPLVGKPVVSIILVTIGLSITIRAVAGFIWSYDTLDFPHIFSEEPVQIGGIVLGQVDIWVILVSICLVTLLFLFFKFTTLGISLQASAQNPTASLLMGISVKRVYSLSWALSGAIGAVAGIIIAPITFLSANMGFLGLKAFPAAIIGGFNSIPGAIVGGVIIGIAENLAGLYLPVWFKDIFAYLIMIAVLMIKPEGIFGTYQKKKV
ncbi:MAG: branched-chain amino acid ABC transporter permease [Nitrospina sp.]|mgnify:CR=1 FL=1|jgi:branched-chain amino acid transport system permease protein|nr:branched-chain amino acid ABC transporter permease [Nitrospina sp.]MBT4090280.1 branched-chain amino acid ABC transporter permease [Deltaproteobacteria bacterium]